MADLPSASSGSLSPAPSDPDKTPRPARTRSKPDEVTPRRSISQNEETASQASEESHDYFLEKTQKRQQPANEEHQMAQRHAELTEQLEDEKRLYPGASTWAKAEERLFEILFLRQDLPLLPVHWDVDFRGVPMADSVFQTSDDYPPLIYAHSKDFRATMALLRLIDLTASVRTTCQSGLRQKAPGLIKKGISNFMNWAAEDGGFRSLNYIPNIIVEEIDATTSEDDITTFMQQRMRTLARVQREFLKVDRDPNFWDVEELQQMNPELTVAELLLDKYMPDEEETEEEESQSAEEDLMARSDDGSKTTTKADSISAESPIRVSVEGSSTSNPATLDTSDFRRRPPVVYGLFILRTSVFILTVDAAKGDGAYVSFHVDAHFMDRHQSVWNALTVAIVVCLARDELMTRIDDFESADMPEESDPDA